MMPAARASIASNGVGLVSSGVRRSTWWCTRMPGQRPGSSARHERPSCRILSFHEDDDGSPGGLTGAGCVPQNLLRSKKEPGSSTGARPKPPEPPPVRPDKGQACPRRNRASGAGGAPGVAVGPASGQRVGSRSDMGPPSRSTRQRARQGPEQRHEHKSRAAGAYPKLSERRGSRGQPCRESAEARNHHRMTGEGPFLRKHINKIINFTIKILFIRMNKDRGGPRSDGPTPGDIGARSPRRSVLSSDRRRPHPAAHLDREDRPGIACLRPQGLLVGVHQRLGL